MKLKRNHKSILFYGVLIVLILLLFGFGGTFSVVQKNNSGYSMDCSNNSQVKGVFPTFSVSGNCKDYTLHNHNINDKYRPANCKAKIHLSDIYGRDCTKYPYIDYAKINVKCEGDKLYVYKGGPDEDWNDIRSRIKCGQGYCTGYDKSFPGGEHEITLKNAPGKMNSYFFICYDYDYKDGWWCWVWTGWGFWGNREVVKSECNPGETKCEGYTYYECSNYKWKDKGKVVGKCGVECLRDLDCGKVMYSDNYCSGDIVYRNKTFYICDNYQCNVHTEKEEVQVCEYGCEDGACREKPVFDWKLALLMGSAIVFCGVLYWFLKK